MVKIRELKRDKEELMQFINFAWEIYRDDANWVAPLKSDLLKVFLGSDIFKKLDYGPHTFFMVFENGEPLARVLVGINEKMNLKKNIKTGYFSYFEAINSTKVVKCLMDHAINWLKEQRISRLIGPLYPNDDVDNRGLLIKGFDSPPVLMTSYNPTYYQPLLEEYGLKKDADFFAYYLDNFDMARARVDKIASFAMQKYHFRIDGIDLKQVDREARDIIKVFELIVANGREEENGFEYSSPPSYEEISLEVKKLLPFIDRDLIYIARSGDVPIGFVLALPDYNQVLKKVNGKLLPFGFIKYLWYKNKIDGIRAFAQFVIPRFRNRAVSAVIFQKILLAAEKKKYRYIEGSCIHENNLRSRRVFENTGIKPYRAYRVYQKIF